MFVFNHQNFPNCFVAPARNVWLKIHVSGDGPSTRDGHACTLLGNEMIIHGGFASRVSVM